VLEVINRCDPAHMLLRVWFMPADGDGTGDSPVPAGPIRVECDDLAGAVDCLAELTGPDAHRLPSWLVIAGAVSAGRASPS
jgi:hypothetical protein